VRTVAAPDVTRLSDGSIADGPGIDIWVFNDVSGADQGRWVEVSSVPAPAIGDEVSVRIDLVANPDGLGDDTTLRPQAEPSYTGLIATIEGTRCDSRSSARSRTGSPHPRCVESVDAKRLAIIDDLLDRGNSAPGPALHIRRRWGMARLRHDRLRSLSMRKANSVHRT